MELKHRFRLLMLSALALAPVLPAHGEGWQDWWLTPEQQGQRAFERGEYAAAAKLYRDPMRIGTAWYRAGEFKLAASAYGRVNSAEAAFNQGNALVLQGQYAAALDAYDRALQLQPGWKQAQDNRDIAAVRLARRQASSEQVGEATEIGADEVVFDSSSQDSQSREQIEVQSQQGMSDQELRALWLRRSQTSPATFLKAKFASQLAAQDSAQADQ